MSQASILAQVSESVILLAIASIFIWVKFSDRRNVIAMDKPQIAIRILPPLFAELNSYVKQVRASKNDVVVSAIA
ncbi:MAG: hypothetical protein EWV50_18345 [Microcystis aeruginosa Ma_MB_F_20061100_S20]|uniref:Uncharacterized protein n=1 Tax=Microcystis aeruginosa Ma_MB_F_20061100_S20D TaxID=2486253 RepID=A0A552EF30_MICAE|nr:MAG: hypothetical protein EWV78_16325 [Microcystis aeruginosa Ma_MB_F_20061100_S20D]TRU34566.1 MAG: hypothetical protein EWV50_18345 [Microcystis aeruginosa Ma_MB_F_20061100_S20]